MASACCFASGLTGSALKLAFAPLAARAVALRDQRLHQLVVGERVLGVEVDGGLALGHRARRLLLLDERAAEVGGEGAVLRLQLARLLLRRDRRGDVARA